MASDGRWQRGQVVEGLYLADSEATARAEWYRWLAGAGYAPREALPRDLWRVALDVWVADLSTPDRLASWALPLPVPDQGWANFQRVGEQLYDEGWPGLVAPSAARPGALVVCLFWRGGIVEGARAVPPPQRWDEPPVPPRGMTT